MNQDFKKDVKKKEIKKILPSKDIKEGKECPHCSTLNELEARFCQECGYELSSTRKCPHCGAKIISLNADICEACGEWLLEGKCKFCYADIEEGFTYCAECGNPVSGIVCPQCGKLSYFDFCKNCNIPLTVEAQKMVEKVKDAPPREDEEFSSNQEARRFFMAQKYLMINQQTELVQKDQNCELLKMKAYLDRVKKEKKKKIYTPLFSEKQKESIESIGKVVNKEIERQEEERKRKEEEEKRKPKEGWLCNAYKYLHPGGPNECADPSQGGHWVTL